MFRVWIVGIADVVFFEDDGGEEVAAANFEGFATREYADIIWFFIKKTICLRIDLLIKIMC